MLERNRWNGGRGATAHAIQARKIERWLVWGLISVVWAREIARVSAGGAGGGLRSINTARIGDHFSVASSDEESLPVPHKWWPRRHAKPAMALEKSHTHRIFANERLHALQVRYPWFCGYAAAPFAFAAGRNFALTIGFAPRARR